MKNLNKLFRIKARKMAKSILEILMPQRKKTNKKRRTQAVKKAERTAAELEYRLQNLGFIERALADLQKIIYSDKNKYQKRPAARVLACWYANQRDKEGARQCLDILAIAKEGEKDRIRIKETTIMEAECHEILGDIEAGKNVIAKALEADTDPVFYFAAANFENLIIDRIKWINRALGLYNKSPISYDPTAGSTSFDCLRFGNPKELDIRQSSEFNPKVTVIMPVYNAEKTIKTAMDSILAQTWLNLEVFIVDDCSTDKTLGLVAEYSRRDDRIQLFSTGLNSGPYIARNIALKKSTGVFITCHDADDWSHPQKIEYQVLHLMQNPDIVGNTSQHIRVTQDLKVYRRGKYGKVILNNVSSFMFRRELVINKIGFWDCVRFRADAEYIRRVRKVFGKEAIVDLQTGPLSFLREHSISLTGNKYFGIRGYLTGARKLYVDLQKYFHEKADSYYYDFPQFIRPFPVPEPMWPQREVADLQRRYFDIIIASDFRLPGGSAISSTEEIGVQCKMGLKTGLVQLSCYDQRSKLNINPKIFDLLDGDRVQMIVYGEKVKCDCLIIRHPPVLQEKQLYIPDIEANKVSVIIDQTPKLDYGSGSPSIYEIERCQKISKEYFNRDGIWYPTGPLIRTCLNKYHAEELNSINLAKEDWVNVIDADKWWRSKRPFFEGKVKVGRHSRDEHVKWLANREELLAAYPNTGYYEIHILGGAKIPRRILGNLPKNWQVLEFGSMHPKEFLSTLDVFVYYTHPDAVVSYDRVVIEAMAVGVPVVIPPYFRELFGDAAVYAEPAAVKSVIDKLVSNNENYLLQVEKARQFVKNNFDYLKHELRIKALMSQF